MQRPEFEITYPGGIKTCCLFSLRKCLFLCISNFLSGCSIWVPYPRGKITPDPYKKLERLMCEVEFFGRCFLWRKVQGLFRVLPIPRTHTAWIGGLEVSVYLLFVNVRGWFGTLCVGGFC